MLIASINLRSCATVYRDSNQRPQRFRLTQSFSFEYSHGGKGNHKINTLLNVFYPFLPCQKVNNSI
jgi:hypothetical protein